MIERDIAPVLQNLASQYPVITNGCVVYGGEHGHVDYGASERILCPLDVNMEK